MHIEKLFGNFLKAPRESRSKYGDAESNKKNMPKEEQEDDEEGINKITAIKRTSRKNKRTDKLTTLNPPKSADGDSSSDETTILSANLRRACSLKVPLVKQRAARKYGSAFLEALNAKCDDEGLCPDLQNALNSDTDEDSSSLNPSSSFGRTTLEDDPLTPCNTGLAEEVGLPQGAPQWAVRSRSTKSFKGGGPSFKDLMSTDDLDDNDGVDAAATW